MLIEYDTYTIAEHWVCAIENGDITGLTDEEEEQLNKWLSSVPAGCWSWSDSSEFSRDAISGLMANCLEARLWVSSSNI
jgi:hypothetical protein